MSLEREPNATLRSATPEELAKRITGLKAEHEQAQMKEPKPVDRVLSKANITAHPDFWNKVLQLGTNTHVLVGDWMELPESKLLPKESCLPIDGKAIQYLFDSLWQQGLRPTGTTVTVEHAPEPFPPMVKDQMEMICRNLSDPLQNPRYHFEEYWSEHPRSKNSCLWKVYNDEETTEIEFSNLNEVITYIYANRHLLDDVGEQE